ncbi:hypothetical protein Bca52824_000773 [Brassica carinata]|uniref:F-box domain-containing protein n=1 Tax=Brassica carinata TaxID=52824 RepID=A0A8X7WK57_BRACI|nr:hypothetical protein Bca52824_000773 [Brassica carinata]
MEEEYESRRLRRWEELDTDILVRIFLKFRVFELARVCSEWRTVCCDPILSSFIKIPFEPYVYVERPSDEALTRILKLSMNLSGGNTRTLVFHFNLLLSDDQLTYTAERRIVLPAWNRIKKTGICKAIRTWKDLESLTMPSIANPPYLLTEIAKNCKNFKELKIMALIKILDGLPDLEVLDVSHSYLVEFSGWQPQQKKASRLKRFLTCMEHETCVMCQRTENDEGVVSWYKYEEDEWKVDEVKLGYSSLTLCYCVYIDVGSA